MLLVKAKFRAQLLKWLYWGLLNKDHCRHRAKSLNIYFKVRMSHVLTPVGWFFQALAAELFWNATWKVVLSTCSWIFPYKSIGIPSGLALFPYLRLSMICSVSSLLFPSSRSTLTSVGMRGIWCLSKKIFLSCKPITSVELYNSSY